MSRARTKAIESKVSKSYRKKGMGKKKARYVAGAVMGNIKRERAAKRRGRK